MATRGLACLAAALALACVPLVAGDAPKAKTTGVPANIATKQRTRTLPEAERASLQQRLSSDRMHRDTAQQRDLERAEAERRDDEYRAEQASLEDEEFVDWEDAEPTPTFGDVLLEGLHALNNELAHILDQRAQQQAYLHSLQYPAIYLGGHHVRDERRDRHRRDESRRRDRGPRGGGADHHRPRPPHRGR